MPLAADILEFYAAQKYPRAFPWLLRDMTTGRNIIWATDDYKHLGLPGFFEKTDEIEQSLITDDRNRCLICPRALKPKSLQKKRSRENAEVFTPAWICNVQNNLLDAAWFGRKRVFNKEKNGGKNWTLLTPKISKNAFDASGRIAFPCGKTWQDYVRLVRMEVACGEAPYLVSRYDCTKKRKTPMPIFQRIGLLDRKLRIVSENTETEREWMFWAKKAFQSIYGFELQGDNLLLARENLLFSFVDYYSEKFGTIPTDEQATEIAEIIAWNIWQMDALKLVVPFSCREEITPGLSETFSGKRPCPGCTKNNRDSHNGIYCKIKDWESGEILEFRKVLAQ